MLVSCMVGVVASSMGPCKSLSCPGAAVSKTRTVCAAKLRLNLALGLRIRVEFPLRLLFVLPFLEVVPHASSPVGLVHGPLWSLLHPSQLGLFGGADLLGPDFAAGPRRGAGGRGPLGLAVVGAAVGGGTPVLGMRLGVVVHTGTGEWGWVWVLVSRGWFVVW